MELAVEHALTCDVRRVTVCDVQDGGGDEHERDEQSLARRLHHHLHAETLRPADEPLRREGRSLV